MLSEKKIREIVREILNETSKKTIQDISDLVLFKIRNGLIILYNIKTKLPIGYIGFGNLKDGAHPVYSIYSDNGYGPLLYELAMTDVYPNGITLDDSSPTSNEAMNVWKKFYLRSDVKKEPINRVEKTWKEKEMIMNCKGDSECLKKIREVLDLHDLKFIYNLGKQVLNKLIENGIEYLNKNPELDIDDMIEYINVKYDR